MLCLVGALQRGQSLYVSVISLFLQQSNEEVAFSRYKGTEAERLRSRYSDNSPHRWNVNLQSPSAPTGSMLHSLHSAADIRRYTGKLVLALAS